MLLDLTLANLSSPMDTRNFIRATDDDFLSNLRKGFLEMPQKIEK